MQSSYEIAEQQNMRDEDCFSSPHPIINHQCFHTTLHHPFHQHIQTASLSPSFKMGVNQNNRNIEAAFTQNEDEEDAFTSLPITHYTQQHSAIKQSFIRKPLYTELLNGRCNESSYEGQIRNLENIKCTHFGELEGIYIGSGNGETSNQVSLSKVPKRKRRKKVIKGQLGSLAKFFQSLVNQLMAHQDGLQRKLLETIERLEGERKEREEAWRRRDLEKFRRLAMDRAHDQALASAREATIVSYLEKITAQNINLPTTNNNII